ncbi:MAG: AraC family transcriptional regulator, partial [Deltaproteobacteria bacterium]
MELTGEGWLGLDVGRSTQISSHGPLGYAMVASPDVGQVLDLAERYSSLRLRIVEFGVERAGGRARLRIEDTVGWGDVSEYVSLHIFGAL